MNNMKAKAGQFVLNVGRTVLQGTRNIIANHEMEACNNERQNNIAIAAIAMMDAGLANETITKMLQKYWDLRLSEAENYIDWAHSRISQNYGHISA